MLAGVGRISSPVLSMLSPARNRMAGKRCQEEPGLQGQPGMELLSLEGNTGNPLSSSASPSATQPSHRWRRKEGERHPSQNPSHLASRGWQLQTFVGMACLSILSGLQMKEGLGDHQLS